MKAFDRRAQLLACFAATLTLLLAMPAAQALITYVDAVDGPGGNMTYLDGSVYTSTVGNNSSTDGEWWKRPLGNGGTVFEGGIVSGNNPFEDVHMIRTTITGLTPGKEYHVHGFAWTNVAGNWPLEATLDPTKIDDNETPGDLSDDRLLPSIPGVLYQGLPGGHPQSVFAWNAAANVFDSPVIVFEGDRTLLRASLGIGTADENGEIHVYIDDMEGNNLRTFFDGLGYDEVGAPRLTINRETGEMVFTSAFDKEIVGYSIRSPSGTLSRGNWKSIADYYDATAIGGDGGLVDANESWIKLGDAQSPYDLSEAELNLTGPQDGGVLPGGVPISFGNAWARYLTEDVTMDLLLNDGNYTVEGVVVEFIGNEGRLFQTGDFNFDGTIDAADFEVFITSMFDTTLTGSMVEMYGKGDLDGDLDVDYDDMVAYRDIYNAANGAGSFQALLAGGTAVPEPSSVALGLMGLLFLTLTTASRRGQLRSLACKAVSPALLVAALFAGGAAQGQGIVYVDAVPHAVGATVNPNPNTTLLGGDLWVATTVGTDDDLWRYRTSASWGNAGIYESNGHGGTANAEDAPMLVTTVSGLDPSAKYFTYGIFWSNVTQNWRLKITHDPADINDNGTPADFSDDFLPDDPRVSFGYSTTPTATAGTLGVSSAFSTPGVNVGAGNERMVIASLGVHSPNESGELVFYVDDLANQPGASTRTWYDGVGYELVLEPTLEINTVTGHARLRNVTGADIDLSYYKITHEGNQLNPAGWNTLDMQNIGSVNGGEGVLDGWDMAGGSNSSLLAEVNFLGATTLANMASFSLGQAFLPGVNSGVALEFESHQGTFSGRVEYVSTVPLAGDYDGNGTVEAADYTEWKNMFGQVGIGLAADGNEDGVVDAADYTIWRNNLGATTAGALALSGAQVPEPAGLALAGIAMGIVGGATLRRRLQAATGIMLAIPLVLVASIASAQSPTLDRLYSFGEDSLENGAHNQPVGSNNTGPLAPGASADSEGPGGAYIDLTAVNGPVYADVSLVGVGGRPGGASGTYGARFDGTDDYMTAIPLNRPDELERIIQLDNPTANYPRNYNGLTGRGMQMWVYPEQAGIDSGNFQTIVMDTLYAGGPAIDQNGRWTQISSEHGAGSAPVPATVQAVGNTWHHVMQHIYTADSLGAPRFIPGSGTPYEFTSVVYVNGIAVSSNQDSLPTTRNYPEGNPPTNSAPNFDHFLVVGASELPNTDQGAPPLFGNFFNGVIDDLEMYVYGNNSSQGGQNWGTFDLFRDNEWIANEIASNPLLGGTLQNGDLNRDGEVNQLDIDAFVSGFLKRKEFRGAHNRTTAGDWETWTWGDMDHDGEVYLNDLALMHQALIGAGLGGFNLAWLSGDGSTAVPEPATLTLLVILGAGFGAVQRGRRRQ